MITKRAAALAIAMACAQPAAAATVDYSSLHVFGDSLSDVGNLYRVTFGQRPESPPYWNGRFSNGPVWADRVANAFRATDIPTGNHAWGGAKARSDRDAIPDLARQASNYRLVDDDRRGDRPLAAVFAGSNDILDAAGETGIRGVGRRAAEAVGDAAESLGRAGVRDFLLFTLVDIGATPRFGRDPTAASSASRGVAAFNRELDEQIAALRGRGARVAVVDAHGLFEDLLAHPRKYGVRNTTTPCLDADGDRCGPRQGRWRAFFDDVHPNRVVHRRLGGAAMAQIDPPTAMIAAASPAAVPLPPSAVLLLAGLLSLGGVRGYQRSRRGPSAAPSAVTARMPSPYQAA